MGRREDDNLIVSNSMIYRFYRERLINLALSQFKWHGLPDTCNPLFFERTLLFTGKACLCRPKGTDFWLSLDFVQKGGVDVYGFPEDIRGVSNNGKCSPIDVDEWEIIYDNNTFSTLMPLIDGYARQLWQVHQVYNSNLQQQITPYIVSTNTNEKNGWKNFFNRFKGYEPVMYMKNCVDLKESINTIDLKVPFIGNELVENIKFWWSEALSVLGITAETTKKERLLNDEIALNRMEDIISINSRAANRVELCNKMNDRHGFNLSVNLSSDEPMYNVDLFADYATKFVQSMPSNSQFTTNYERGSDEEKVGE